MSDEKQGPTLDAAVLDKVLRQLDLIQAGVQSMALEAARAATLREALLKRADDHEDRIRNLEASDRKWATLVLAGTALINVAIKVLWP